MRAKDYIESNCKYQFYNELKQVINDLSKFRNNNSATENYYDLNLVQDRVRKRYIEDLNDWKLNNLDDSSKPIYIENELGISHQDAYNFRNHLFKVIETDKSFGYLFYLLASEKNRSDIFYQNKPIDCIPDKNIIEENIKNYQDDYPKHNLEAYLTYCDFNYSFYKANKKLLHTQDFWFSIFTDAYSLFDNLRTKMVTPFLAYDLFKEYSETNKSKKILITTLVTQLLEQYNFDLSEEQVRAKKILVDEIQNYLNSLKSGEIPADPIVRSVGWLSEHPELMTIKEQQTMLNTFKLLKDFGNKINAALPPFDLVKTKIDETPEIDEKIKILEDVIATWEVNKNIAIKHRNDDTAEEIGDKNISLFTDLLNYWKKMKELHDQENLSLGNIHKDNNQVETSQSNDIIELTKRINSAFLKLEAFMNGSIDVYKYFGFNNTFTLLFAEIKKTENYTYENCKLINDYWKLTEQIRIDYDKASFDNDSAYDNDDFCKDCDEITYLNYERVEEFCEFRLSDESIERKFSNTDILQNREIPHKQTGRISTKTKQPILLEFLNNSSDLSLLVEIQSKFKHYEGKRLAILIYLLQNEKKIINIIPKSRTHSRKHFVCLFKEEIHFKKMFAVDKYIDSYNNNLNLTTTNENDADYIDVKEKLNKIIENRVV